MENDFEQTAATQPELLAHHYTEAGETEKAVQYWLKAGQHAQQRSANTEAISHLTRGLEVLETLRGVTAARPVGTWFSIDTCSGADGRSRLVCAGGWNGDRTRPTTRFQIRHRGRSVLRHVGSLGLASDSRRYGYLCWNRR